MQYSKAFERDYKFYLDNLSTFSFAGKKAISWTELLGRDGLSAKECFYIYDSTGEMKPCRCPQLLERLLTCKASVNLNIKLWAQGVAQGVLCPPELTKICAEYEAPEWVLKSALRQGERKLLQQSREKLCQNANQTIVVQSVEPM